MEDGFWGFVKTAAPKMEAYNNKFIIPLQVVRELENLCNKNKTKEQARKAIQTISSLKNNGLLEIQGEESDGEFADRVFDYVFSKFKIKYNLLLITQDKDLAKAILDKNYQDAIKGKKISCKRIKPDGSLGNFCFNKQNGRSQIKTQDIEKFKLSTKITSLQDSVMDISHVPKDGDYVIVQGGKIRLVRELAKGGEGSVFETDTNYVAKIYKKEKLTIRRYEKIRLMLSKRLECDGICYPISIVYNESNEFVGYLMPRAKGVELGKSIFKKPLFLKKLPNWNRKNLVELCITILQKIYFLHERNIILGDINPANILIVSPKEVYFVDTDSYQIEEFPCPVGTENFTASEIQGKNYANFLRTKGNEYFALATLLFMIMLPGKPPYSQQDGASASENIKNASFPYPFGESSTRKAPDGAWRFMWSHLPRKAIKEAFYNTFSKSGDYFLESNRLSAKDWLAKFEEYLRLFESNKLQEQDSMSNDIYPTRLKKQKGVKYVFCKICGVEKQQKYTKDRICVDCIDIEHKRLKQVVRTSSCKNCGNTFHITRGEYEYYVKKRLTMPKRCETCRGQGGYNRGGNYDCHNNMKSNNGGFGLFPSIFSWFGKL